MSSKFALFCITFVICSYYGYVQSIPTKGLYTIVAPGTIRSQSVYQVSVSLIGLSEPWRFDIVIEPDTFQQRNKITQSFEVDPGTTKLIKIQMPQLNYGQGRLIVIGTRGIIINEASHISIEDLHYTVYVQTDKAKYRPGEVLQFRVICIDRLTRPAKVKENIVVQIYDGQRNLIKQISDVKLVQGVFKGNLQISEYPVLGDWKIEVKADGRSMQERSFQVARYVLPIFSVEIIAKKNVALDEGQIAMRIKTSYTYGEPVIGNLTVDLDTIYSAIQNSHPKIRRESQINGETEVTLDFDTDLNITRSSNKRNTQIFYKFSVLAKVQDALSMRYSEARLEIAVHNHPYKIKIDAPDSFDPEKLVDFKVSVTDLENNLIQDTKNPVKVTIAGTEYATMTRPETTGRKVIDVYLNKYGIGAASLNLTCDGWMKYKMIAEYLGWLSYPENIEKTDNTFNLDILTERPEVGKELVVQLRSIDPITYFVYEIVSRGEILQTKHINVPGNATIYLLRINATYAMVPKITLFIHRIINNTFDSRLKEVYIKRAFQNSIKIDTIDEAHPGALVPINVTTDAGSYVGLMGVDKKLLLDTSNQDGLTEDHIFTDLRNYDALNMNVAEFPGSEAGLITFSNAQNRHGFKIGEQITFHILSGGEEHPLPESFDTPSIELPRVRQLFSDSWIFKDFESTPAEGLSFSETIPDTITSWAITAFSLNPNTGLTLTRNATTLKVFQKFFISMELPSLVKEGEIVEIPVYLFNYMDQNLLTDITISSSSADLEFLDNLNSEAKVETNKTSSRSIPAQGKVKLMFLARSHKSGSYNVTVKAISSEANDAIQRTLTVTHEGVPYSFLKTYLVHFLQETEQGDTISLDIPKNAVQGSESVELSVVGDIFGPLMRSLQKLARFPYGNGEDNIRYFVSNLLVLKYLKTLNHTNPSLEQKAKLHLEQGYQNQMAFKHVDGSFSFLGWRGGFTGDIWLTAYVMWGLQQAKEFIVVDSQVIDRGLNYLKSEQRDDGGFSSGMGAEKDVALTAFTLLSFLADDEINEWIYSDTIRKSLDYLYKVLDNLEESIPAVVSTYALVLGKHEKSAELLSKLSSYTSSTSKRIKWSKSDTLQSNLETTAATLINLLESQKGPMKSVLPIISALVSTEQDDKIPTQLIALDAMIAYAQDMDLGRKDLDIHFSDSQGVSGDLYVNTDNSQILQTIMLSKTSRNVNLATKGSGFAIINIKYTYNILSENQSLSNYRTRITIKESTDLIIALEVCVAVRSSSIRSNLTAIEINLQSGYAFDGKSFDEFHKQVRTIQFNGNQGSVLVYAQDITDKSTCIPLEAFKTCRVFEAKPASVVVYDVHKENQKSVSFFGNDMPHVNPIASTS